MTFFFGGGGPETVVVLKYEQKIHEISEILKYAQKVPILVFGIGIRLNLSVLELLELFEKKKKVCKSSNRAPFKKPQRESLRAE